MAVKLNWHACPCCVCAMHNSERGHASDANLVLTVSMQALHNHGAADRLLVWVCRSIQHCDEITKATATRICDIEDLTGAHYGCLDPIGWTEPKRCPNDWTRAIWFPPVQQHEPLTPHLYCMPFGRNQVPLFMRPWLSAQSEGLGLGPLHTGVQLLPQSQSRTCRTVSVLAMLEMLFPRPDRDEHLKGDNIQPPVFSTRTPQVLHAHH